MNMQYNTGKYYFINTRAASFHSFVWAQIHIRIHMQLFSVIRVKPVVFSKPREPHHAI